MYQAVYTCLCDIYVYHHFLRIKIVLHFNKSLMNNNKQTIIICTYTYCIYTSVQYLYVSVHLVSLVKVLQSLSCTYIHNYTEKILLKGEDLEIRQ